LDIIYKISRTFNGNVAQNGIKLIFKVNFKKRVDVFKPLIYSINFFNAKFNFNIAYLRIQRWESIFD